HGSEVDEAVDDAHGDPGVALATEIGAGGARQHAVHADDRHRHDHHDPADAGGAAGDQRDADEGAGQHHRVEHRGHRPTPRLEHAIGYDPGEHAAEHAGDAQQHAPVVVDEGVEQPDAFTEVSIPVHDRVAQIAAAELDERDGEDDR